MIDSIIKHVKNLKIKDYEVYYAESDDLRLIVTNNKIDFASEGKTAGFGIRVLVDGKLGFSSTTNLDNFKSCIERAVKIAKLSDKDKNFKSFLKEKGKSSIKAYDKKLLNFDIN